MTVAVRLPLPRELGLPEKYQSWRPSQEEAAMAILDTTHRHNVISAPTGFGKTAAEVGAAIHSGEATCVVVESRGLQDQLYNEFKSCGMVDIRGRSNYQCEMREDYTCEDGFAARCPYKGSVTCPRSKAEIEASLSRLVVTNYDMWTASKKFGTGMNHFTRVIFDEAHAAPDALARAMQVKLGHREIEKDLEADIPTPEDDFREWKLWAAENRPVAEALMCEAFERIRGSNDPRPSWVKQYNHFKNLNRRLGILATASAKDWVVDPLEDGWQFDPIRPAKYAESALFFRIPHIGWISATVRPKTLFLCGVSKDQFTFNEYQSDFNPKDCPIYHIPTMRVDFKAKDLSMLWVRHDQIAARRQDRKGIVHTVSYLRRDDLLEKTRFYDSMIVNPRGEPPTEMVELFKASRAGTELVSPSVGTGYDFPGNQCEWQFICKIPYPPPSKIVKAREEDDKEYRPYIAMQKLVQMCGRGARFRGDRCENFIADDHIQWFLPRFGHLAPRTFHAFYKEVSTLPAPPEAMRGGH